MNKKHAHGVNVQTKFLIKRHKKKSRHFWKVSELHYKIIFFTRQVADLLNLFMIHTISSRRANNEKDITFQNKQTSCDRSNIYQHLSVKFLRFGKTVFYTMYNKKKEIRVVNKTTRASYYRPKCVRERKDNKSKIGSQVSSNWKWTIIVICGCYCSLLRYHISKLTKIFWATNY